MAGESEQLIQEIIELTEYMRKFTRTVIDAESALAKAIGKQTQAIEKNTKQLDENTKSIEDNTDTIEKNTEAQEEEWRVLRRVADQRRREENEIKDEIRTRLRSKSAARELTDEFGRGATTSTILRDQFEKLAATKGTYGESVRIATAGLEGLFKATTQMAAALYKGERGTLVAAKAATELTKPLTELGTVVGTTLTALSFVVPALRGLRLLGLALSGTAAALNLVNKYNELAAEQTDKLFKGFNELSKSGINLTRGFGQVFEMAQTLGLTVAELEEFNKLLTSNTQTLAMFGGTAARGAERFASAAGILVRDFGRELELMGVDRTEQREIAMSYMNIQARTGQIMNKSVNQLAAESAKYVKELDMLAELTGSTRKQQQEAREAALAETRFRAARIEAERRGDTEQMRKLDIAERASAVARAAGDVRGATGILQAAAGRGALTTPEAIAAEQTYRISELMRQPNPTEAQIAQHMGKSVDIQQRNLAGITALIGNIDILQTDFVKSADLQRRQLVLAQEAEKAGFGRTPEGVAKFLETEAGKRMAATPEQQAVVDAGRAQQNAAMLMDSGIRAFNGAAQLSLNASKMFADAVSKMPGAKITGGGLGVGAPGGAGVPGAKGGVPSGGTAIPDLASKIVKAEGGAVNARNPYSSASGLGQITKGRYSDLVKEAKIGSKLYGTTFEQYQGDESLQKEALNAQIENLRSYLASKGLSTTDAAVYMAHVFGPGGARSVLTAGDQVPVAALFNEGIIKSNPAIFRGVSTVGDLKKVISDKMGGSGYREGGIARGPASGYQATLHGTEAVVPLPDGKEIPVRFMGMSSHGDYQQGPISTDTKLTDMIMQRLGLTDLASKKMINMSGLGTNYNLGGAEFGSKIGGGVLQADIADQVGRLVEGGQPLQEALKSTLTELNTAMQEFVSKQSGEGGSEMLTMLAQLIELQRNQNRTSEKILQVSQN